MTGARVAVGDQDVAEARAGQSRPVVDHGVAHDALPDVDGAHRLERERSEVQRRREHGAPARPLGHDALGDGLGEVARRHRVHAHGQVRPVLLERAHGEDHDRPVAVERVERRRRDLFQQVNAQ